MLNLRILRVCYNAIFEQMFIRSVDSLRQFVGYEEVPVLTALNWFDRVLYHYTVKHTLLLTFADIFHGFQHLVIQAPWCLGINRQFVAQRNCAFTKWGAGTMMRFAGLFYI
jgi:hypothetical protein